jgi:hypothetical protein
MTHAPCLPLSEKLVEERRVKGASIDPAVQNTILARRALGLGTTIDKGCESDVKDFSASLEGSTALR